MPPIKPSAPATTGSKAEAASVTNLLTRLIVLIDEIVAIMEEEIPLVEGRKRVEHAELLKRKQRVTLDYRASLKAIVMNPQLLNLAPEKLRAEARIAAQKLAHATNRNSRMLRAIMTASQRLVQSIVSIVKSESLPKLGYGKNATGHMSSAYSPTCKPVTVYRTV